MRLPGVRFPDVGCGCRWSLRVALRKEACQGGEAGHERRETGSQCGLRQRLGHLGGAPERDLHSSDSGLPVIPMSLPWGARNYPGQAAVPTGSDFLGKKEM